MTKRKYEGHVIRILQGSIGWKKARNTMSHKALKEAVRKKLEGEKYEVFGGKCSETERRLRELHGGQLPTICHGQYRYPDLVAFKGKEFKIVEVKSNREEFARQLLYDTQAGKTILVLPFSTEGNLHIWDIMDLYQ